jgi:hypothetical protein
MNESEDIAEILPSRIISTFTILLSLKFFLWEDLLKSPRPKLLRKRTRRVLQVFIGIYVVANFD